MYIVKVFAGEKQIAEYPDCLLVLPSQVNNSEFVYVVPDGTQWGQIKSKFVCYFPRANTNVSAIVVRQEEQE